MKESWVGLGGWGTCPGAALEGMSIGAPNLIGPAEIRAVAEAVVPAVEAEQLEEEELAQERGVLDDPVVIDA